MRTSYKYDIIVMKISPRLVFIPGKNQTTCFFFPPREATW